jgi:hypothetical protein
MIESALFSGSVCLWEYLDHGIDEHVDFKRKDLYLADFPLTQNLMVQVLSDCFQLTICKLYTRLNMHYYLGLFVCGNT